MRCSVLASIIAIGIGLAGSAFAVEVGPPKSVNLAPTAVSKTTGFTVTRLAIHEQEPLSCQESRLGAVALSGCYRLCVCAAPGLWLDTATSGPCPWRCEPQKQ